MDLDSLRKVGLSDGEVKVYSAVLESGLASLNNVHEKTGIERRNIYDIINKLVEKGLVAYTVENGKKRFQITHPRKIMDYLEEKKKIIERMEQEIQPQISDLTRIFNSAKGHIRAEVYRGNESIKALLEEGLDHKENYWIGGNKGLDRYFPVWWAHFDKRRINKKVFWYDLADQGLVLSGAKPGLDDKRFYELRFLPKALASPMVILVFGDKVAQILWSDQSFAFVIESKEISLSFMKYFQYFWDRAKS
ncbi:MAG: helix-turn-helix domain-containing protein [Nanoarchaeota archaeon]